MDSPRDAHSALAKPNLVQSSGPIVFRARRPAALVIPLAAVTEVAGFACILSGAPIGWFIIAAPAVALLSTGLAFRPSLELTQSGVVQRQYPFSSITRWESVDHFDLTRAGNRVILAYRLHEGVPAPKRQPAAAVLRAAGKPFDGGFFADSLAAPAEDILAIVRNFHSAPERRASLPQARR